MLLIREAVTSCLCGLGRRGGSLQLLLLLLLLMGLVAGGGAGPGCSGEQLGWSGMRLGSHARVYGWAVGRGDPRKLIG